MSELSENVRKLLAQNKIFASNFQPSPSITDYTKMLAADPYMPRVCIIACCDPRVIPESIFGLGIGEAIVIRTAGGSLEPALASMLAIDSMAPLTDVVVMRHTDCGTAYWTDEGVREVLKQRSGTAGCIGRRAEDVDDMWFCESTGSMGDEELLRKDVEWLRASPLVRQQTKIRIVGMIYVTETGEARVVC